MKTGMDVFKRAMSLLGYTGIDGAVDGAQSAELLRRGLDIINQVLCDLWPLEKTIQFMPMASIHEDVPLAVETVEGIMPYGVAMFLAQADGDGANQQFYAALYQQKRNAVRRYKRRRRDVLPAVWED